MVYLTRLGHFEWLRELFGEVLVPPAVWDEIAEQRPDLPESATAKKAHGEGWLKVREPTTIEPLAARLDPGEREAIALAKELDAHLIVDDGAGRMIANELGIKITGRLGLIIEAKQKGLISSAREVLERLTTVTNFRLDDDLMNYVLEQTNE